MGSDDLDSLKDTKPGDQTQEVKKTAERGEREEKPDAKKRKLAWPFPWPVGYIFLWLIAISSLALNVLILQQLVSTREAARQAVRDARAMVVNLQDQGFSHTIKINETLPVEADLPVKETIPIPINETFTVNAAATIPINLGPFGSRTVTVPVGGEVPVNTTIEIELDRTFHVSTVVPVNFEVPIDIKLASTPLYQTLLDVENKLESLEAKLSEPMLPFLDFLRPGRE